MRTVRRRRSGSRDASWYHDGVYEGRGTCNVVLVSPHSRSTVQHCDMNKDRSSAAGSSGTQPSLKVEDVDPVYVRNTRNQRGGAVGPNLLATSNNNSWGVSQSYEHRTTTTSEAVAEDLDGTVTQIPRKRSPSPFPDLYPRIAEKRDRNKRLDAKQAKRDLTCTIVDTGMSNVMDTTEAFSIYHNQAQEEIYQANNSVAPPAAKGAEPGVQIASAEWLLDPAISSCPGMLVVVLGSSALHGATAWHGGDYEGAQGIVLSVHNTGADTEFFPSTARVKFLKPLHPPLDTFAVPVSLLCPVAPGATGQQALIIRGPHKGKRAKLWEEVSQGWYVCAAYDYFEVAHEDLVRLLPCAES
ncbi:hypothetical protein C8Q73DRAFT_705692 [Cubamyces lactineus]|nr:hypothetical protein C8Q73DRAFT_705692 [Cubamyces lactineus]